MQEEEISTKKGYLSKISKPTTPVLFGPDIGIREPDFLPAQLHYFYVYNNYGPEHIDKLRKDPEGPLMLTYDDRDTQFSEFLEELTTKRPPEKGFKYVALVLSDGCRMRKQNPVASLTKITNRKNIDGILLFAEKKLICEKGDSDQDSDQNLMDECAMQDHLTEELSKEELNNTITINFLLPGEEDYVITTNLVQVSTVQQLINDFFEQVVQHFGVKLTMHEVDTLKVLRKGKEKEDLTACIQNQLRSLPFLVDNCAVKLVLKKNDNTKNMIFKRNFDPHGQKIAIIRENNSKVQFRLEEIQFMTFGQLYKKRLAVPQKSQPESVCLKVMDIIVTANEHLSKITRLLKNIKENEVLDMVGRVVTEKMYFYKTISSVADTPNLNLDMENLIEPDPKTQEEREFFRSRIKEKIRGISERHKVKDIKAVEPIYIYTCEDVHHRDENDETKTEPVYKIVNKTLREDYIFNKPFEVLLKDWKYLFTSSLLSSLSKINPVRQTVYRAVDYNPNLKIGDIYTFKAFISTSRKYEATIPFQKGDCTVFYMKILNGKAIKQFSQFGDDEDEVLLQPYTQFRVKNIEQCPQSSRIKRKYYLQQLSDKESSSQYPKSIANFILWIDDKQFFEGEYLYKEIADFEDPTILIHFKTDQQLRDYLQKESTKKILMDPTAKILFITNMTREGNPLAGIDCIVELQKHQSYKEIPIFMYVGLANVAYQKINNNSHRLKNAKKIKAGENQEDVQRFILSSFGKKVEEPKLSKSFSELVGNVPKVSGQSLSKSQSYNNNSSNNNNKSSNNNSNKTNDNDCCLI